MPDQRTAQEKLHARLQPIINLLNRQHILEEIARRQSHGKAELLENLVHRQWLSELGARINDLPPADLAHLLEMLPPQHRQVVWDQVGEEPAGEVLWEVSEGVAEQLIESASHERLVAICKGMDVNVLAQMAEHMPEDVLAEVETSLPPRIRSWLKEYAEYPEDSVGRLMNRDVLVIDLTATVKDALKMLRNLEAFPDQVDALYVVDSRDRLAGVVPLTTLLLHRPRQLIAAIMRTDVVSFLPRDDAGAAAQAFERYDLLSAPVVDERRRLVGRLPVDVVMDFIRAEAEENALRREGLSGEEDLFGRVWDSARRRWLWLSINLLTAFAASRVIGLFEGSIEKLVALATLMPIVASIGGNTGNQTVALFIRGLALDQINTSNLRYLAAKEAGVAGINGLIWGSVMGLVAFALYQNPGLGLVMGTATFLNLVVAALCGIAVPYLINRLNYDPALGSSVLLTFSTDSMGFFIFLGLASIFLV